MKEKEKKKTESAISTLIYCNDDRPNTASLLVLSFEANLRQVKVGQMLYRYYVQQQQTFLTSWHTAPKSKNKTKKKSASVS